MRFLHLADLHLGKSIHGVSLLDNGDQRAWVERFLALTDETRPDAVVVAGDIYDRGAPSGDAVQLLDRLLTGLARRGVPVMLVAGNHDSGQRLAFAGDLLAERNVHIAGLLPASGELRHVTLEDGYGPVTFWLMPYVFPALVSQALGGEPFRDYDAAVRALLAAQKVDITQRNVIVAHQNVTANGAEARRGGSETMVGGVGQVDYTAFNAFDYAALGHIHAGYSVGRESVRYAGSPLCYHFDETRQPTKGPVLVTLGPKGDVETKILTIPPLHPMREARGAYDTVRQTELAGLGRGEYVRVVLTDRRVTPEIAEFFREMYASRGSILMELVSEWSPYAVLSGAAPAAAVEEKTLEELFGEFFAERIGSDPTPGEEALLRRAGEIQRGAADPLRPAEQEIEKLLAYALGQEATP